MALTDYNKKKPLEVSSQNDSGATVNKAQPVLITSGDDSTTGTGDIVVDDSNITSQSDVAFYDQNGNTLPYELENGDTAISSSGISGTLVGWVYHPNGWTRDDSAQAQVVYGDGPASSEENVTGTWNNTGQNAEMVQHLQDDPLTATDSTSNNNDGTVTGAVSTTGQFDGAASFDGTDDIIEVSDDPSLDGMTNLTYSFWTNTSGTDTNMFAYKYNTTNDERAYQLYYANGEINFIVSDDGSSFDNPSFSYTGFDGNWHLVTFVFSGNDTLEIFVDGNSIGSETATQSNIYDNAEPLYVGDNNTQNAVVQGGMDEVKLHSKAFTQAEHQAEYDASPKAGQVFFSQSAAETTTQEETNSTTSTVDAAIKNIDDGLTATVDTATIHRQNGVVDLDGSTVRGAEVHIYNISQQRNIGHDQTDSNGEYQIDSPNPSSISSGDKLMVAVYYEDGNGEDFGQVKVTVV